MSEPTKPVQRSGVQDHFEAERYLAHRLRQHGVDLFEGLTDTTSRAQKARAAIVTNGLAAVLIGRFAGKPDTYASYFERTFGQSIVEKAT